MKKKTVLSALALVFLLSALVVASSSQERTVGITVGDWFKYGNFNVSWSSTDPNATFPPPGGEQLEEMNETEWMLVSIENISRTWIFLEIVKHFKDETEKTENGSVDIETGSGIMFGRIISADLDVNDTIYTDPPPFSPPFSTWKICETIVRTYPDGERETNHLNTTQEWNFIQYKDSWAINVTGHAVIDFYWDRSTGILVEYSYNVIEHVGEYVTTTVVSYRITESNVWIVREFPSWTLITFILITVLILVVITAAIVIYKRRLLKH